MKKLGYEDPYCNVHIPSAFEEVKLNKQKELDQTSRRLFPTTQNVKERPARTMYQG